MQARRLVFVSLGTATDLLDDVEEFVKSVKHLGPDNCLHSEFQALGCHLEVLELAEDPT